ncbi:M20 family metallo-hydrolase [Clostridium neuense]|uniref:M20 family metallo-hydrolase n=1 Tax=Clostridium neuense TaxID=1728934 RepID=A0ABW8TCX0_9CLOT
MDRVRPNIGRLKSDIERISTFIDKSKLGHTRRSFTEEYKEARVWLREKMEESGLETSIDAAANIIGRLSGSDNSLKPIIIGSHTDTVENGGMYDGTIGVLGGIEVVRILKENGVNLRHPLEIVDFTSEEPSEFGLSTIGSKGMIGELTKEMLQRRDNCGRVLSDAIHDLGGNSRSIKKLARKKGDAVLYLELHNELGPVLDNKECPLGVVTGIVGIHRYKVIVNGEANHAGTTPMNMRCDALVFTSKLVLKLQSLCKDKNRDDVVGTVGKLNVEPNASNVIPGKCEFEFEVRSLQNDIIDEIVSQFIDEAQALSKERNIKVKFDNISKSSSVIIDEGIKKVLKDSCEEVAKTMYLPSGAGHDANHINEIAPVGMIFVPSKDGKSHCPEEYTSYEEIEIGVHALIKALLAFDKILK